MDFFSTLLKERKKGFFRGSKRSKLDGTFSPPPPLAELAIDPVVPYPYPYSRTAIDSKVSLAPTTSQWSPVSVTFDKPHVLVKRSKSLAGRGRRSRFQDEDGDGDDSEDGDRKSKLLSVVILPLSRRKSKSDASSSVRGRKSPDSITSASPTPSSSSSSSCDDVSSISSRKHTTPGLGLRRSASHASVRGRHHHHYDVPPLPLPPVPKVPEMKSDRTRPTRPKTADSSGSPRARSRPRPQPIQPQATENVEGYWDHLQLFDESRVPSSLLILPRRHQSSPVPF
ncbi:hypothetical protein V5O48_013399 [Marasmius crinis-equi]|uniref:Uncharacterized protein n=1 Tax=Marasmius crinis-equi TaxID=585013 RepID=A0ABR3F070_9AGAR